MRLASYERAGKWAAAVAVSEDHLVDAVVAAQRSGLAANGADWTSVRAQLAAPADRPAALGEAAEALLAEAHPDVVMAVAGRSPGATGARSPEDPLRRAQLPCAAAMTPVQAQWKSRQNR